jgi:hypothetical protein
MPRRLSTEGDREVSIGVAFVDDEEKEKERKKREQGMMLQPQP